jgi:hypothetical protein
MQCSWPYSNRQTKSQQTSAANDGGNRAAVKNHEFKTRVIGGSGSPLCSSKPLRGG